MKWKVLFFSLLGINSLVMALLLFYMFQSSPSPYISNVNVEGPTFTVQTSKQHLNALVNDYIQKHEKKGGLPYNVQLADRLYITSAIPIFGKPVDLTMAFDPKVDENGHVVLAHPTMTFGQLRLPVPYVLTYINKHASLPNWVKIDAKHERIYIVVSNIRIKEGLVLKAKTFDLNKNDITFTVTITK
ncbi:MULTISPECIES: YpmS family protein [Anoxybacillus]|uniref:DUF2140 family protein n=1 Tax=Anoxybacillus flavithermus TaxID=33934 RepID=A0A178TBQ5_9BACL|nr:YpmS family protein [Anoxybacillus flavithermus]ASA95960.1 hypothetical protein CA592_03415 [Anoxybacillus flavithermus]ELK21926.1 hypothetical protein AF6_1400 [Anoxybacillus flavithermus TNO-09.006]MBE2905271.1 YpmS family protein [Anoxybacillus flavithermus]MBE2908230.1 YpmS family protein [Anoxybacillus flavithermus]MBE2910974.1 YpmS family protein [Anoxybacillus flavithermus]